MKNSPSTERAVAIYRTAAQNMEQKIGPEYSCWAVNWVVSNGMECSGHMLGEGKDFRTPYEEAFFERPREQTFNSRNERIVALCFMAAMVEAGDA